MEYKVTLLSAHLAKSYRGVRSINYLPLICLKSGFLYISWQPQKRSFIHPETPFSLKEPFFPSHWSYSVRVTIYINFFTYKIWSTLIKFSKNSDFFFNFYFLFLINYFFFLFLKNWKNFIFIYFFGNLSKKNFFCILNLWK